jgi:peptidoglycan-associated lipoprotein
LVSLRLNLKNIVFGSLSFMTIEIGVTRIDQIMKKSSLNILVTAVFPLVLSGCSIVVFEDGEDCLAEMECPMAAVPSIDTPNETIAAVAEPAQPDQSHLAETETPLSDLLMAPPLIDGYVANFAYDSAELGSQAIDDLKAIAAFLADKGDMTLVIEGHCDERGSRDYNLALGARRAIAMRDVLTANGVDANRIRTVSYGKERPVIVGSTPEAWARNRRAVIRQQTP